MRQYSEMDKPELDSVLERLSAEYEKLKTSGLKLDMSRGKPNTDQLMLAADLLDTVNSKTGLLAEDGTQCGNYTPLDGIPEAKSLMAGILDCEADEVFVGGNSSLNLMHDCAAYCWMFPVPGGDIPWGRQEEVKFLCPVPGYDRHFAVTEHFGIKMIPVPMTPEGPDMDMIESLVKDDASIKGIWCVPKYSNPQGITYSGEVVDRLARLEPKARDFRIFWDNAYAVHDFYDDKAAELAPILPALKKYGHENNIFMFASTSKITFPGGGIAAIGASAENIAFIKKHMSIQTIGFDKINQLRHARYFKDIAGIRAHMKKHAVIMREKFGMVLDTLGAELDGLGLASWGSPLGGYFISLDTLDGCAKRVVSLCKEAGLVMTPAGATHPYGDDPEDKTIRIAPSFPALDELHDAAKLLCLCVKIASAEKYLAQRS